MIEVEFHPDAELEYGSALRWYLDRSERAAAQFEVALGEVIEKISSHPLTFPMCDDLHRFVILKRYPYIVVYRIDGDKVRVIALAHSKRRPGYWSIRT